MNDQCRKSHFGNCSDIRAEGYCLFHHPDKNHKQSQLFYAQLVDEEDSDYVEDDDQLVLAGRADWAGYVFPPPTGKPANAGLTASSRLFANTVFSREVDLRRARFDGQVDFSGARFEDRVDFTGSTFSGHVSFARSVFKGGAFINHCRFASRADFSGAAFRWDANFSFSEFVGPARFAGTLFAADASFIATIFARYAEFTGGEFRGRLDFTHTVLRQGVGICDAGGEVSRIHRPDARREAFRIQKDSLQANGRTADADEMYVQEMRSRRQAETHRTPGSLSIRLSHLLETMLVDWTCKYATSWQRLLVTAVVLIFVFAGIYHSGGMLSTAGIYDMHREDEPVTTFGAMLYLSAQTFSVLGYGDLYPTGWLKYIAGLQSLVGGFTMALFVVIFARRWARE